MVRINSVVSPLLFLHGLMDAVLIAVGVGFLLFVCCCCCRFGGGEGMTQRPVNVRLKAVQPFFFFNGWMDGD